jgi:hypothetical protein
MLNKYCRVTIFVSPFLFLSIFIYTFFKCKKAIIFLNLTFILFFHFNKHLIKKNTFFDLLFKLFKKKEKDFMSSFSKDIRVLPNVRTIPSHRHPDEPHFQQDKSFESVYCM